ncbi:MAPEG family protein [Sphingomonas ginkgonis]|uniref:MAPEG family protein n=1 Tax=Sphingomonas ginkgonis TaxID=2315330 RepID=A0A3R9X863_9SPHN|nr:MAPEG family protein [Sphingomonas ginkgonis]RST31045.1 MAPEG family protein [Sphingomonas ginkgonis]
MNHISPLLGPLVALVAWTIVMLFWAVASSVGAARQADPDRIPAEGTRLRDLEGVIPAKASWPRQNYEHLLEQPTLFYAILLALVAMGDRFAINLWLAWAYVALRVVHSLYQSTVNVGRVRGLIFVLATLCLLGLTLHAAIALFHRG